MFAALLVSATCERAQAGLASVWAVDDGEKIFRDNLTSPLKTGNSVWNGSSVSLSAAKNETAAFQLILQGDASGASTVSVTVSDLTNGANTIRGSHPLLAANNYLNLGVELFAEHYLNLTDFSGAAGSAYFDWSAVAAPANSGFTLGWIPDALIPFAAVSGKGGEPFNVVANQNQGVWADIYVKKALPAGVYTGTITVKVNSVTVSTIPLSLQVLNFTLPDENHFKTMIFTSHDTGIALRHNLTVCTTPMDDMVLDYARMAHRHRLELIYCPDQYVIDHWLGVLNGSAYTSAQNYEGPGEGVGASVFSISTYGVSWTDTEAAYRTNSDYWENWFTANAPNVERFLYLVDEPGAAQYPWIQTRANWIHNNPGPGKNLKVFVTKCDVPDLAGYVDDWCSATANYYEFDAAPAKARGDNYWAYAAYRPKTGADVTDEWGIGFRIKPWIAYKCNVDRWFTWESTYWQQHSGTNTNVFVNPLTFDSTVQADQGMGDGLLFYPGQDYIYPAEDRQYPGPISSLRMKMYRRGAQDYEYMWLASQAGHSTEVQTVLNWVLPRVMDNAPKVPDWSNANAPYEQARLQLADLVLGTARAPVAEFKADRPRGNSPLTVSFTDLSLYAPTSWTWAFGDGATSTAQNPSHTYTSLGYRTVSLTARNASGQDTETKVDYIGNVQEVIVYPDTWKAGSGRCSTSVVSGTLADLQADDGVYHVTSGSVEHSSTYTGHSGYTPSQVARITLEYQAKTTTAFQPPDDRVKLAVRHADATYETTEFDEWRPRTFDRDYTWETTDVATYMAADGILGFSFKGCSRTNANYQISSDLLRWRVELKLNPPVANFTGNPTSGPAPLTVAFTDTSTGSPTSWSWTFGDGGTSTAQNPSHTYTANGSYTVALTAANSQGSNTNTKPNYITVAQVQDYTCASLTVNNGTITSGDHTSVHTSDNIYLVVNAAKASNKYTAQVSYTFNTGLSSLSSLTATEEGKVSTGTQPLTVYAYNYSTSTWTSIATGTLTTTDSTVTPTVSNPSQYISGGTVQVRVKAGGTGSTAFSNSTDLVKITAAP